MLKWMLALTAAALLPACSGDNNTHSGPNGPESTETRIEESKQLVAARLLYARDVEYRNLQVFPRGVVCGEVSEMDPMGTSSPFKLFIVRAGSADVRPSEDDWQIFCSDNQVAALQARFGIGPLGVAGSPLETIRADIGVLNLALKEYTADNYILPSTPLGLATLTPAGKKPGQLMKFPEGGYISVLPLDPWGRDYQYERSGLGGVAHSYRIYTLGADGVEGGQGDNADVSSDQLKYLDHLDN
jgi:type II secretion system protein G